MGLAEAMLELAEEMQVDGSGVPSQVWASQIKRLVKAAEQEKPKQSIQGGMSTEEMYRRAQARKERQQAEQAMTDEDAATMRIVQCEGGKADGTSMPIPPSWKDGVNVVVEGNAYILRGNKLIPSVLD